MAHYFITGHTGFKGAWLIFMLKAQGHEVSGLALDPIPGSIFDRTDLQRDLLYDYRVDIRNREETIKAVRKAKPDYVIHMAAQALVREGYRNPLYTYDTNVAGTLNVLEAINQTDSIRAQLVVTTDKVYLDQGLKRPYVETDPLGGKDPYSASKAMADILSQEYLSRDNAKPGAVARAGNVIGAGDVAQERLIPDIVRAMTSQKPFEVRYSAAVRPWQHVLDCLGGYLALINAVATSSLRGEFNFGPEPGSFASVGDVVKQIQLVSPFPQKEDIPTRDAEFQEETYLLLSSVKSRRELGWSEVFRLAGALEDASVVLSDFGALEIRERLNSSVAFWLTQSGFKPGLENSA